jgi:hypothetical protein
MGFSYRTGSREASLLNFNHSKVNAKKIKTIKLKQPNLT